MTNKQTKRPDHINKAMKELRSYARSEMAKTEIVQFRVDKADFERLVEAATACQMPMGAMVRDWVLNRLEPEGRRVLRSKTATPMIVAEQSSTLWTDTRTAGQHSSQYQLSDDLVELRHELSSLKQRLDRVESKSKSVDSTKRKPKSL